MTFITAHNYVDFFNQVITQRVFLFSVVVCKSSDPVYSAWCLCSLLAGQSRYLLDNSRYLLTKWQTEIVGRNWDSQKWELTQTQMFSEPTAPFLLVSWCCFPWQSPSLHPTESVCMCIKHVSVSFPSHFKEVTEARMLLHILFLR